MRVGSGDNTYEWIESWARVPDTESARNGWSHHGIVVSESGDVLLGHQGDPVVQVFDKEGYFKRAWPSDCADTHGLTLVKEDGAEYLWIADNGDKLPPAKAVKPADIGGKVTGQAVKKTLEGDTVLRLDTPPLAVYEDSDYMPTGVAVNEERHGGNGDVWVADGYGAFLVHRYSKAGDYIGSITGEEGEAGAFDGPHTVLFDTRKSEPTLYVADRTNGRVQVYDAQGNWKRVFGSDFLISPSAFAIYQDLLIIAEFKGARVTICDSDDNLVAYLGANESVVKVDEGWPNKENDRGEKVRQSPLETGKFNSPHGVAVDPDGNLYIVECLIGGRTTKLAKV